MKAIVLKEFGDVEVLGLTDLPVPKAADPQVLLRLKSISINPIDVKTRSGKGIAGLIKGQLPAILGWDVSGVVIEVGSKVSSLKKDDEVFGMIEFPALGNAYAEFVAAEASQLTLKPKNITHNEAAAASLAALTAWQALTAYAKIQSGDRVLIHAASGGVGHYAVQIAKHFGAWVIGTSSSSNRDFVISLGADEHIDYKDGPFENRLANIDFVLDTIGGDYIDRSLSVMRKGGTIVSIPSGLNETVIEKARLKGIKGYTMRVKPDGHDMQILAGLLEKRTVISHISKVFAFEDMVAAHLQMESGKTAGKIVLEF